MPLKNSHANYSSPNLRTKGISSPPRGWGAASEAGQEWAALEPRVPGCGGAQGGRRPGRVQYWLVIEQHCTASRPSCCPGRRCQPQPFARATSHLRWAHPFGLPLLQGVTPGSTTSPGPGVEAGPRLSTPGKVQELLIPPAQAPGSLRIQAGQNHPSQGGDLPGASGSRCSRVLQPCLDPLGPCAPTRPGSVGIRLNNQSYCCHGDKCPSNRAECRSQ